MPPRRRRQRRSVGQLPNGSYRVRRLRQHRPVDRQAAPAPGDGEDVPRGQEDADSAPATGRRAPGPKSDITGRRAIEQWLDVVELEVTTRERYDDLVRLYLLPTSGDLKTAKLDAELLERFYASLHRCRDLCSGKAEAGHVCRPLSSSTTRKVHYILRDAPRPRRALVSPQCQPGPRWPKRP